MSEPTSPPGEPPQEPPPPPQEPPQEPPPPPPAAPQDETNPLMVVLSYLWLLALVPFLVEKEDKEVQWHAKHGLVLMVAEIVLWIALAIVANIPLLGAIGCVIMPLVWLAIVIVHVVCIVKGLQGQRFLIPYVSQYADRF